MTREIPLFEIAWDGADIANVTESIARGSHWAKGPYVEQFERGLEEYLGIDHAVVVNSGSSALECALLASGVRPGDDVVVPSFTFIATVNAVERVGATPVFADIEPDTYGLDPADVEERLTDDTTAIVPVHAYGRVCGGIEELRALATEAGVALVEDAAEAQGARLDGEWAGTVGDAATLSFCQNKVLATGEGGAVVTADDDVAAVVRDYRSNGRLDATDDEDRPVAVGGNYRMPDMVAALGCAQLARIESVIDGRRRVAHALTSRLQDIPGVDPPTEPTHGRHVFQLYTVELGADLDRATVVSELAERGVDSQVYWDPPLHQRDGVSSRADDSPQLPVTEDIASRVLSLPLHPNLSDEEVESVASALEAAVARAHPDATAARDTRSPD